MDRIFKNIILVVMFGINYRRGVRVKVGRLVK